MNAKLRKLISYSDFMQAQLVMSLLEGSGIPVLNRSDNAGGLDNGLFASNGIHLYVHEDNFAEAMSLIDSSNI